MESFFLGVVIVIGAWILLRPISIWYWKIDEIVSSLKRIQLLLETDRSIPIEKDPNAWKCPSCGSMNHGTTFVCGACKVSLR